MFINPKTAIEQGWITHPTLKTIADWENSNCLNPNAIDFTIDQLFIVDSSTTAIITEETRQFRDVVEVPIEDGKWEINKGVYDGMSTFRVNVPENVACLLFNRSTFNRCGVHLNSGLYDTGFKGNIGFTLTNRSGTLITSPGTRVGQIAFVASESVGHYAGIYNGGTEGEHWTQTVNK